ncbi:ubiquinol-cytochrome c reductase iron-sulfur subunit [Oceanobacillus timonensis]|uniref:QcrA and Rieske domain-containing protein n=1 Tax=Oceanobacillus timonensis TaxID=1926285 RepID=UPI0009B9A0BA|nr:ubiquinol-cytochrome c reductase iron-sulfur subunit [Oceanobacillus timonensis]
MSDEKRDISRRQFLNYTLTGVGGFMAAGLLISPVRMAIDPVLKHDEGGDFANVGLEVSEITSEPQRVDWTIDQVDGWYESEVNQTAWVYRNDDDEIVAFSPVCKHLGCFVSWEGNEDYPEEYFCPCHNGRYYKNGVNVPGTPPLQPLDVYEQEERDGMLFLGNIQPHEEA